SATRTPHQIVHNTFFILDSLPEQVARIYVVNKRSVIANQATMVILSKEARIILMAALSSSTTLIFK
ncbi:MAG: hypothetical protein ACJAYK_002948, partial [Crocinitomicaceae bacterium]